MRPLDPAPRRKRPTMRELVDRELRRPVRAALLGPRALPDARWMRVHSGAARPLGVFPELTRAAGLPLPVALRRLADAIERDWQRAA